MTMKRSEKATGQTEMARQADGYTSTNFAAPKLRAAAKADRGHTRMTPSEYRTHRLGRKAQSVETAQTKKAERTRYPRKITRK